MIRILKFDFWSKRDGERERERKYLKQNRS